MLPFMSVLTPSGLICNPLEAGGAQATVDPGPGRGVGTGTAQGEL